MGRVYGRIYGGESAVVGFQLSWRAKLSEISSKMYSFLILLYLQYLNDHGGHVVDVGEIALALQAQYR